MYDSEEEKYYKNLNAKRENEDSAKFIGGIWALIVLAFF